MTRVGVRELRDHLSRYLARVRDGEQIVITDRGEEVAVLVPAAGAADRQQVQRLIERGIVRWSGKKPRFTEPVRELPGKPLSEIIIEDRGEY